MARLRHACCWPTGAAILLLASFTLTAAGTPSKRVETKAAALLRAKHLLERHQAQVSDLQQQVAKQEATTRLANDRLKQQDQAIEKMQQDLNALRSAPVARHR